MTRREKQSGRIGSLETRLLVLPLVAALAFLTIAVLMGISDRVGEFDAAVIDLLYPDSGTFPLGSDVLAKHARDLTALGSPVLLGTLTIFGIVWLIGHRDRAGTWFLFMTIIGASVLSAGLKAIYGRERPPFSSTFIPETTPSFPSGHSLITAALLPALAIIFIRQESAPSIHTTYLALAILLAILVGVTRVILGAHYPTDVVAGWAVGFGWVSLSRAALALYEESAFDPPRSGSSM